MLPLFWKERMTHAPRWNYIWQTTLIFVFLIAVLNMLLFSERVSNIAWAVGAGSLASSAYFVLSKTSAVEAHSYILAISCGMITHYIGGKVLLFPHGFFWMSFLAAFAVVATLLLMIWVKAEHPPAVGMALVLVIDLKDYYTSIIVLVAITVLVTLKLVLRPWLRDLY
jgi:CBS domain-containing membrane protein